MAEAPCAVWFHRACEGLTGGQVKHADYFEHVRQTPGFVRRIAFAPRRDPTLVDQQAKLWPTRAGEVVADWAPKPGDVLFVAGTDWRYVAARGLGGGDFPVINLVQHVRHAREGSELRGYLANRAIRLCVSQQVAHAVRGAGANGPVLTMPNGIELPFARPRASLPAGRDRKQRNIVLIGYKRPELAREVSRALHAVGLEHVALTGFLERRAFLRLLAVADVAICLPHEEEGFYLPALEAMASGCLLVTLDCIGNRSFCQHSLNCLMALPTPRSVVACVARASALKRDELASYADRMSATVAAHSLQAERSRFQDVLRQARDLWKGAPASAGAIESDSIAPRAPARSSPLVDFMIVGAQKSGTTALRLFLEGHPQIALCGKESAGLPAREAHLFDDPNYSSDWTPAEIDQRYAAMTADFASIVGDEFVRGEGTPIYMYLPAVAAELKRYNPRLKLIVVLRDPVERAISHYYMSRRRGEDPLPLWLALLAEPLRLALARDPLSMASRDRSYRSRGLYARQLRNLYRHFDRQRVLVIRHADLLRDHDACLRSVFAFLDVADAIRIPPLRHNDGRYPKRKHVIVRLALRLSYLRENRRLRKLLGDGDERAPQSR